MTGKSWKKEKEGGWAATKEKSGLLVLLCHDTCGWLLHGCCWWLMVDGDKSNNDGKHQFYDTLDTIECVEMSVGWGTWNFIFHNCKNVATFSQHFWVAKMLRNGIITSSDIFIFVFVGPIRPSLTVLQNTFAKHSNYVDFLFLQTTVPNRISKQNVSTYFFKVDSSIKNRI